MRFLQKLSSDIWRGIYQAIGAFFYIFWRNKKLATLVYLGIILNLISWGLLYWLFSINRSGLILHYNAFLGIDIFANLSNDAAIDLDHFISPLGGLCFFLINITISLLLLCMSSNKLENKKRKRTKPKLTIDKEKQTDVYLFGAYLIMAGNIVLQALILVYTISILLVNK